MHIRSTVPRARKDDFAQAMELKLRFVLDLAQKSPPLITAGDLLDVARSDQELEQWLIRLFREYGVETITVPGQHELPEHSLVQYGRSSMAVLEAAGVVRALTKDRGPIIHTNGWAFWGCAWGETPDETMQDRKRKNMLIWHHMVTSDPLWPTQEIVQPGRLLREYPWYDIILTGDNHSTVLDATGMDSYGKVRRLINPGSMMRQTAAQVNHRPCVFRYEGDHLAPEQIFLPIQQDVLDLTQLQEEKARDSRIEAFVERLDTGVGLGLDYVANLKSHLEANPVRDGVRDMTWRCVGN
jgi:hypothetical protein